MKNKKSFVLNVLYNFLYNGLNIAFPLLTAPYVSRVLGPNNLGQVNFANIVVNWFILFACFGIPYYGIREVAKRKGDKAALSKIFSELFTINLLFTTGTIVIYFLSIFLVPKFNQELGLFLIFGGIIFLNIFSIDWFFQGMEQYQFITVRSLIIKTFSLICIFLLLRNPDDYLIYASIIVVSLSFGNILNFLYSRKLVVLSFMEMNLKRHFRSLFIFFVTALVVNVYTNVDQLLLGFLSGAVAVAFTNRSRLVINTVASLSNSIINVALPRTSYYLENDNEAYKSFINIIPRILMIVTFAISSFIFVMSDQIIFLLGGQDFIPAGIILKILSVVIIFSQFSTFLQYQIMVPKGFEKLGLMCSILASIVSLLVNFILIPRYGYVGAAVASVAAEFVSLASRMFVVYRLEVGISNILDSSFLKVLAASLISGGIVFVVVQNFHMNVFISLFLNSLLFFGIYVTCLIILKESIFSSTIKNFRRKR